MHANDNANPTQIEITVNGQPMRTSPGKTVLQALLENGIHVPHLCYEPRLDEAHGQCGVCVVALEESGQFIRSCQTPVHPGMNIQTDSAEVANYRRIRIEQLLADHNADCVAPCEEACPAGIDIQAYLRQVANGNFDAALRIIKEKNPFPVSCGRVCPHPCEAACRRNLVDDPVAINPVKRCVADIDLEALAPFRPEPAPATGKRIGIVGAGPSGLSAAYYLALRGHDVTVFDQQKEAGGMMRYGIPDYRLPQHTLDQEIQAIWDLGVKFVPGRRLGAQLRLEDMRKVYDAVYVAVGSWRASKMRVEGEHAPGVWQGINYLEQVAKWGAVRVGAQVAVIGGGNTAIDCARTALRSGAEKVTLVYRRTQEEMPAEDHEIEAAIEEGVVMELLAAPVEIVPDAQTGRVKGLRCVRMRLGAPDRSGRRRPEPIEGSEFLLDATDVIGAIGQSTDTSYLWDDMPLELNRWGDVEVNADTLAASVEGVFAGGDCVSGPATVVQAVGAGRRAAEAMDQYIFTGEVKPTGKDYACKRGALDTLPQFEFKAMPKLSRAQIKMLAQDARKDGFAEVEHTLSRKEAMAEAERCLKCGCGARNNCPLRKEASAHGIEHRPSLRALNRVPVMRDHPFIVRDANKCISCGKCVAACNDVAGSGVLGFYLRNGKFCVGVKEGVSLEESGCVSCGQCVNACPCGALDYSRESDKVFRALNSPGAHTVAFVAPAVRAYIAQHYNQDHAQATPYLAGMLKALGFDRVFDFVFAADLTIMEETREFLGRLEAAAPKPMFTSCCPGWVNFVEREFPDLIGHLSTCKSPQQMMGATVKNHYVKWAGINTAEQKPFVVSVVPCMAKKHEAARPEFAPEGIRDVDAVLTTGELIEMIEAKRIDPAAIMPSEFDHPYRRVSGAGVLFGASGGVAEAALRMAAQETGGAEPGPLDFHEVRGLERVKTTKVNLGGREVRLAVISGLPNVRPLMERLRAGQDIGFDLIEVMACPGGCIAGAGHPVTDNPRELAERKDVLARIDAAAPIRRSQDNPDVVRLYEEYFGEPNSETAHRLLHTHHEGKGLNRRPEVHRWAESAYRVRELRVCVDEPCLAEGAYALLEKLRDRVHALRMDHLVTVGPALAHGHSECPGPFVSLDGQRVSCRNGAEMEALLEGIARDAGEATAEPALS